MCCYTTAALRLNYISYTVGLHIFHICEKMYICIHKFSITQHSKKVIHKYTYTNIFLGKK